MYLQLICCISLVVNVNKLKLIIWLSTFPVKHTIKQFEIVFESIINEKKNKYTVIKIYHFAIEIFLILLLLLFIFKKKKLLNDSLGL